MAAQGSTAESRLPPPYRRQDRQSGKVIWEIWAKSSEVSVLAIIRS